MSLLPFDLILTVGTALAVFILGWIVWWRKRNAVGNMLYALIAYALATWTATDWILHLLGSDSPRGVFVWKLFFYLTVCVSPALAVHAAGYLARRAFGGTNRMAYVLSAVAFACMVLAFVTPVFALPFEPANTLTLGALFTLFLYAGALALVSVDLYPIVISGSQSILFRRRATYGLLLLIPFLLAGCLQMVAGPLPTGFFLPFIAAFFLVVSLLAFIRATFLDVELGPLEAFFLLLTAFAGIIFLRSDSTGEAVSVALGSIVVGSFGFLAIRTVRNERAKRLIAEDASRQLRLLERARKDFVDMVAHQLRTPLGGIRGSASMLTAGDYGTLPSKAKDAAQLIEDAATRLLSLAESFLSASRVEVGKFTTRRVEVHLRNAVKHLIAEMSLAARAKRITIQTEFAESFPETVLIDQEIFENAVFNLIDNAIKYTEKGKVTIACTFEKNLVVIRVRDTGIGMTPTETAELFQKFQRGAAGRSHAQDGTGLGLYIVKELVEAAGGSIHAESDGVGKGTTFTVRLPCECVDSQKN